MLFQGGMMASGIGSGPERGAIFFDGALDRLAGFAGSFLDATEEFVLLAFDQLEVIVSEFCPLLFEVPFDDVPVAFEFEFIHRAHHRSFRQSRAMGRNPTAWHADSSASGETYRRTELASSVALVGTAIIASARLPFSSALWAKHKGNDRQANDHKGNPALPVRHRFRRG